MCEDKHPENPDVSAKPTQRHNDLGIAHGAGWLASHGGLVREALDSEIAGSRKCCKLSLLEDVECEQLRHYLMDNYSRRLEPKHKLE